MNTKVKALLWAILIMGSPWIYAQQPSPSPSPTDNAAMAQYQHFCMMQMHPNSPASILVWKEQLGLSEAQSKELEAIQDKAIKDAQTVLSDEQRRIVESLTAGWKVQSPMQCMQGMMGRGGQMPMMCPMMEPSQTP